MEVIKEFWLQYYPVILTIGGTVVTFVAGALVIWSQVKPIYTKLTSIFDKVKDSEITDVSKLLQQNDMATKITDLKAKINNPTTSEELRQEYITQLTMALELKAKIDVGLAKAEEVTDKYL